MGATLITLADFRGFENGRRSEERNLILTGSVHLLDILFGGRLQNIAKGLQVPQHRTKYKTPEAPRIRFQSSYFVGAEGLEPPAFSV